MDNCSCAADFTPVMEALREYAARTGEAPLLLGGWEADDPAIAPPATLAHTLAAITAQPRPYTYSKDFWAARERAADLWRTAVRYPDGDLAPEQVAVLPNSSQGLFLALTALRERGARRAVVAAPCYYAAVAICRHLGLAVDLIPTADYVTGALDIPRLARAMRRKGAILILTNPAYSLGVEYGAAQLQTLFAALPDDAVLLLDETRLGVNWDHDEPWYTADFPRNALILRSPSKIFLLNGSKTSFLLGSAAIIRQIEQCNEALLGSVAGNLEPIALAYLDAWAAWSAPALRAWRHDLVAAWQRNLATVRAVVEPAGFTLSAVDSGPYALAAIPVAALPTLDSQRIAHDHGVLLMTSEYFHHQHPAWQGFRVNLCGCPDQARAGLARVLG